MGKTMNRQVFFSLVLNLFMTGQGRRDFWIGTATYDTFQDIKKRRYPVMLNLWLIGQGNIYNYSARMGPEWR